jgi:hypothetical protein
MIYIALIVLWAITVIKGSKGSLNHFCYTALTLILLIFFIRPRLKELFQILNLPRSNINFNISLVLIMAIGYFLRFSFMYFAKRRNS